MTEMRMPEPRLAVPVSSDDHSLGRVDANVVLLEYGDFACGNCAAAARLTRELRRRFGDALRFVFRNMPLAEIHPQAELAAEAAEAAGLQGRFWEMHDLLFEHQRDLRMASLVRYAAQAGADPKAFDGAIRSGKARAKVQRDVAGGVRSGVTGAPTFFVNGTLYSGPMSLKILVEHLGGLM
jgi:protein-disulfide isomerase